MGNGDWVKSAREDAETGRMGRGAAEKLHADLKVAGQRTTGRPACPTYTEGARSLPRPVSIALEAYAALASISSMVSPVSDSNSWRSAASWHLMQYLVHGTASRRFGLMSSSQCMQIP